MEDGKKSRPDRRRLDRVRIKYAAGLLMSSLAALGQRWGINSCGQRGWIKRSSPEDHHITAACVEYLSHPTAINTGMEFRCYKPAVTASALPAPEALPLQGRLPLSEDGKQDSIATALRAMRELLSGRTAVLICLFFFFVFFFFQWGRLVVPVFEPSSPSHSFSSEVQFCLDYCAVAFYVVYGFMK